MPRHRISPAAAASDHHPDRLLLAIAHPDDEALFFVPALLSVAKRRDPLGGLGGVDVICLSTGNAAGLGAVRTKELGAALPALLGGQAGSVTVVDHPGLQDGMHTAWDVRAAADAIMAALHAQPAGRTAALLSFDGGGVTGHPNHAATAAAVVAAVAALSGRAGGSATYVAEGPAITAWRLRSLPWYLAWLGPAALVVLPALAGRARAPGGRRVAVLTAPAGPAAVLRGLAAHASQRTWWRVLGALARSASYVSVLDEIK